MNQIEMKHERTFHFDRYFTLFSATLLCLAGIVVPIFAKDFFMNFFDLGILIIGFISMITMAVNLRLIMVK